MGFQGCEFHKKAWPKLIGAPRTSKASLSSRGFSHFSLCALLLSLSQHAPLDKAFAGVIIRPPNQRRRPALRGGAPPLPDRRPLRRLLPRPRVPDAHQPPRRLRAQRGGHAPCDRRGRGELRPDGGAAADALRATSGQGCGAEGGEGARLASVRALRLCSCILCSAPPPPPAPRAGCCSGGCEPLSLGESLTLTKTPRRPLRRCCSSGGGGTWRTSCSTWTSSCRKGASCGSFVTCLRRSARTTLLGSALALPPPGYTPNGHPSRTPPTDRTERMVSMYTAANKQVGFDPRRDLLKLKVMHEVGDPVSRKDLEMLPLARAGPEGLGRGRAVSLRAVFCCAAGVFYRRLGAGG